MVDDVKAEKCSAKETYQNIKVVKDHCLKNFSVCKKAEDVSIGLIHSCNGGTTPGTEPTIAVSTTTTAGVQVTSAVSESQTTSTGEKHQS